MCIRDSSNAGGNRTILQISQDYDVAAGGDKYVPLGGNDIDKLWNPNHRGAPKQKLGEGGCLGTIACMVLMTILYPARVARFDIFQAIQYLAKRVTRWDSNCDARLAHLMCYIYSSVDNVMVGWIGDDPKKTNIAFIC